MYKALALTMLIASSTLPSLTYGNYDFIYSCKMEDHTDEDGKLKPDSKFKYFLCIQRKRSLAERRALERAKRSTTAGDKTVIGNKDIDVSDVVDNDSQDHNMVFSISNVPVTEYDDTTTHTYETVGIVNVEGKEVGMIESFTTSPIREDVMEDVLKRFTRSRFYTMKGASGNDFEYEVSVAAHLSMEDVVHLRDKANKMIDSAKRVLPSAALTDIPLYGYFRRVVWPLIKHLYGEGTNYLPIGLSASGIIAIFYTEPLHDALASYAAPEPPPDFGGCLISVRVSTSELLVDMHRQNVTSKLFTIRDTVGSLYEDILDVGGHKVMFQTTGRFREFLTEDCHCPRCGAGASEIRNNFGSCDVDLIVDSNFMFINILELYQGDVNTTLTEINTISAYIDEIPNWNFLPKTHYDITGDFRSVDTVNGGTKEIVCGCDPCPREETTTSQSAVNFCTTVVTGALAATLTIAILLSVKAKNLIIKRIKASAI